jgi:hypothetical protein
LKSIDVQQGMLKIYSAIISFLLLTNFRASAQDNNVLAGVPINYKLLMDEPLDLNRLWLHAQPIAIDGGSSNLMAGFSLKGDFLLNDKIELTANFRAPYGRRGDFSRSDALSNGGISFRTDKRESTRYDQSNTFGTFYVLEAGGIYYFKTKEKTGDSRVVLPTKDPRTLEITNSEYIKVNTKYLQLFGARLGVQQYATTLNLNKAMEKQAVELTGDDGSKIFANRSTQSASGLISTPAQANLYSTFEATSISAGFTFTQIKNHAIKAEKYGIVANNSIFSTYADILFAPAMSLSDVRINNPATGQTVVFDTKNFNLNAVGWKAGFEFKFNEEAYMSFGGEIGVRPSVAGRGFYTMARIGVPVYSLKPKRDRPANNVGPDQSVD